ncbi:MAG: thiamine phosphate synthase [Planctomycetes bacterium]|nr:thiamine phosphate synthase [Planctomycetota bacterium]
MDYQFTPAALRCLAAAERRSGHADSEDYAPVALLLGLLEETETRAAGVLAECHIDPETVERRWPTSPPSSPPADSNSPIRPASVEPRSLENVEPQSLENVVARLRATLAAAIRRLAPRRPWVLATEHLLLGLVAADHEVGRWLHAHGLDADTLEREIHPYDGSSTDLFPAEPLEEAVTGPPLDLPEDTSPTLGREGDQSGKVVSQGASTPGGHLGALRVIDASANRAREGLRVVEDYVRFVLDDRHLTAALKQMRHDLRDALAGVSTTHRLAARETQADVGTRLTTPGEFDRAGGAGVMTANFVRLQEALRSLEEFGKIVDVDLAARAEHLRYRAYTLQRAVHATGDSLRRLGHCRLYVLIDGRPTVEEFTRLAGELVEAGVDVLQLRDKTLDDRRLLKRARLLREMTAGSDTLFIVNDRPDLAVLARADGVHVGQEELTIKDARTIVGPDRLVGVSTHSIQQARQAVLDGAGYIGVGPTFASATKQFDHFPGLELLEQVAHEIRLPAFAIGGITQDRIEDVLATGIGRIAASGAILSAADPAAVAVEMRERLRG